PWYKTKTHPLRVFRIPRQIPLKKPFLIQNPPYQRRDAGHERQESPPRAERERYPEHEDERHGVHRMADYGVRPRRDDPLILFNPDGGGAVGVLPEHEVKAEICEGDKRIAEDHDRRRNVRPPEAMI